MTVTPAIPASEIVSVTPSVVSAGGNGLDLNGLIIANDLRTPFGYVQSFETSEDIADYYGPTSQMAALGSIYFLGFNNSTIKPGRLLVAPFPVTAVSAWLRSGRVSSMSLAALQSINAGLSVMINTVEYAGTVNLAAANSFSNAASIIDSVLAIPDGASTGAFIGSISGLTLTVTSVASGTLEVGGVLSGTSVTAGTYITALGTGTGGVGTYTVSVSQTMSGSVMTVAPAGVTYDSVQGAFVIRSNTTGALSVIEYATGAAAALLKLTSATGAILSQGQAAGTAAGIMNDIIDITQNWATFFTSWEPTDQLKEDFASWNNAQGNRYMYAMADTGAADLGAGGPSPAVAAIQAGTYAGTALIYDDPAIDTLGASLPAFLAGSVASLDFTQTQGRTTMKFRRQSGLAAQILNASQSGYLNGYGINYYGDWTTADDEFIFFSPGKVTGDFVWIDSYVNQIWLNAQFQLALMVLLTSVRSIPYNRVGYAMIEAACKDVIIQGLNFGAIQPGVTLSESQKAQVNNSAGMQIDVLLSQRGWFMQVKDASPQVRMARASPPCSFWYTDGQSIHLINLASINVQ